MSESEQRGRCRQQLEAWYANNSSSVPRYSWMVADAIDRLSADVAEVRAKVDAVAPEDVRHFVEAEKAWVKLVEEQRDEAIRERDEARAEVETAREQRGIAVMQRDAAITRRDDAEAEVKRLKAELDDREQTEQVKRLREENERQHRASLNYIHDREQYKRLRDEARAEVERLKAIVHSDAGHMAKILIENERLRAAPAAPQPAAVCPDCNGEGQHDSGGTDESGKWLNVPCETCRCTGAAPGAPQPAAPPAGWLTPEERAAMERARDWMQPSRVDLVRQVAGVLDSILTRAGSPPPGWLTEEERFILRNLSKIKWADAEWYGRVTTTLQAILTRAGAPPVVEGGGA